MDVVGPSLSSHPALTSTANPRVKNLVRLRRRRTRDEQAVTLVEGHDELALALDAGARPIELYYAPDVVRLDQLGLAQRAEGAGAQVTTVSRAVLDKITYRESPDGWIAVLPTPGGALGDLRLGEDPVLLVNEGLEKPGNLGALLRTAEAAGVTAVINAAPITDFGNPNVVRASKGTVFAVQLASGSSAEVLSWLRGQRVRIVVTTPRGRFAPADVDLRGPVALVVGSESSGVSDLWVREADETVRIPMYGQVNSLNAAAAGAIGLYEVNRQRTHPAQ